MSKLLSLRQAQLLAYTIAVGFMAIHVAMLVMFSVYGVAPMAYFNVASILCYVVALVLAAREKLREFTVLVYLEVVAHMTLAVYFTGWGSGFQITLIGISALVYFAEYIGRYLKIKHVHALPLCVVGMCAYVGSYIVTCAFPAPYALPAEVSFWLQVCWGIVVFSISIVILQLFILSAFRSEDALSDELQHDELTGLPNRRFMSRHIDEIAKSEGLDGYWLAMADIDDFKVINDTYGHLCGDYVLKELAEILQSDMPEAIASRWGGEEFLMMGRIGAGLSEQVDMLDRLRQSIYEHPFWYDEHRLHLSITIGVSAYEQGKSTREWVNAADKNLYIGKTSGKNRVVSS